MTDSGQPDARLDAPAFHRNIEPITEVFHGLLADIGGDALEVGCGSGQHAARFAATFPAMIWWPSDPDPRHRLSADAWRVSAGQSNLRSPVELDARIPDWPLGGSNQPPDKLDLMYSFNVIHIAPWPVAEGILRGAAQHLVPGGRLVFYGPFKRNGRHTAESNAAFDESLRARDPSWGVRDLGDVEKYAGSLGLMLNDVIDMPSNNLIVVFTLSSERTEP